MDKINVIYILGRAFTGSTILGMLLGCHPQIENIGEFFLLPRARNNPKFRCGCGELLTNCDFWQGIFSNYESEVRNWPQSNADSNDPKNIFLTSPVKKYSSIFLRGYDSCFSQGEIYEYGYKNRLFFQELLSRTGKEYIVDVSKNPYRLFHLVKSGLFNIKVIYLYRDGRSSIASFKKRPDLYKGIIHRMFRIHMGEFINQKLLQQYFPRCDYYGIRYESLTLDFDHEMSRLFQFLRLSKKKPTSRYWKDKDILREILSSNISHSIGGNAAARFKQTEILNKDSWNTSLTKLEKIIYLLLGGWYSDRLFDRRFLGSARRDS